MAKQRAARRTPRPIVQTYKGVTPYLTKDRSVIRELMHPGNHGNATQSLAEAIIPGGARTLLHKHQVTEELYHVTHGSGLMTLGGKAFRVSEGDTICILPGTPHCIEADADQDLHILCCCSPAYSHEDTEILEGESVSTPEPQGLAAMRKALGLTQAAFWGRLGVTQSAGSRYETGRSVPFATIALAHLMHDPEDEARSFMARLREPCRRLGEVRREVVDLASSGQGAQTLRAALGLSQAAFWDLLGITQSSGSRYEAGEEMPVGTATLLRLLFLSEDAATNLLAELRS
jgi:mannose-6-phosphate isomerase-like protein (cupin superfamily)/transcriptional regulator with XRE-family HTH domain